MVVSLDEEFVVGVSDCLSEEPGSPLADDQVEVVLWREMGIQCLAEVSWLIQTADGGACHN